MLAITVEGEDPAIVALMEETEELVGRGASFGALALDVQNAYIDDVIRLELKKRFSVT